MIDTVYTAKEVATLAKVSEASVKRAAYDGRLRFVKLGRSLRFPAAAVREWLERGDVCLDDPPAAGPVRDRGAISPTDRSATVYPWDRHRKGKRS
jgi:excisionase family DNA binding protein